MNPPDPRPDGHGRSGRARAYRIPGLGLALAGITHRHPVTLVTDPGIEPLMLHQLRSLGARVETVDVPHPVGGWQQAWREKVRELLDADPAVWCPDQYHNPDNPGAYAGLAHELAAQLGHIDTLVAAVGTGGHSAGAARVLRRMFPGMRLVGVDSIYSTVFGQPAGPRLMRGLDSSIHPANVEHAAFDGNRTGPVRRALRHYAAFDRPIRFLMVQQFTINASFYMLMPYLAAHLTGDLGLAAWAVSLVLGVRNLSQQGMFLLGGSLADRLGYKRVMTAGCVLRTAGFALLGAGGTLPVLIAASAATGFAGAQFNPAVRAYLADRPFVLFATAMTGSYILSYQVYLILPLAARQIAPGSADTLTAGLFAASALVATVSQVKIAAWAKHRLPPLRAVVAGLAVLTAAFALPPVAGAALRAGPSPWSTTFLAAATLFAAAMLIALATAVIYPFEMDTVVALANGRLVATHYGLYNTITGVGITLGNLGIGAVWGGAQRTGLPWLPWLILITTGLACTAAITALARSGLLRAPAREPEPAPMAVAWPLSTLVRPCRRGGWGSRSSRPTRQAPVRRPGR